MFLESLFFALRKSGKKALKPAPLLDNALFIPRRKENAPGDEIEKVGGKSPPALGFRGEIWRKKDLNF